MDATLLSYLSAVIVAGVFMPLLWWWRERMEERQQWKRVQEMYARQGLQFVQGNLRAGSLWRRSAPTGEAATERAEAALCRVLSVEQAEDYDATGAVDVIGSAGGRYRLFPWLSGNVFHYGPGPQARWDRQGKPVTKGSAAAVFDRKFCAVTDPFEVSGFGRLPVADQMLAQLLMLQTDEPGFLRLAVPTPAPAMPPMECHMDGAVGLDPRPYRIESVIVGGVSYVAGFEPGGRVERWAVEHGFTIQDVGEPLARIAGQLMGEAMALRQQQLDLQRINALLDGFRHA